MNADDHKREALTAEYQAYLAVVLRTLRETPCESDHTAILNEAARYINERWAAYKSEAIDP